MSAKTNSITVDGTAYYSVQGKTNPKKAGSNPNGAIPDLGAYLEVVAPAEGTITVYGYPAAGKPFYGTTVSSVSFADEAGAVTEATVNGTSYTVELKNGEYTTSAVALGADGYSVFDHVAVAGTEGEAIANDVWFYGPAATYGTEYKEILKVGKEATCDYATITEALAAAKAMTRTADQWVTLELSDEEYVEQVITTLRMQTTNMRCIMHRDGVLPFV